MSSGLVKYSTSIPSAAPNKPRTCQHCRLLGYKRPFDGAGVAALEDQNSGALLRFRACVTDPEALAYEVQLGEAEVTSRKGPSFAVALNCGIGSRLLKALVNALDRLHIVRGANCSNGGWRYCCGTHCAQCCGRAP